MVTPAQLWEKFCHHTGRRMRIAIVEELQINAAENCSDSDSDDDIGAGTSRFETSSGNSRFEISSATGESTGKPACSKKLQMHPCSFIYHHAKKPFRIVTSELAYLISSGFTTVTRLVMET